MEVKYLKGMKINMESETMVFTCQNREGMKELSVIICLIVGHVSYV